MNIGRLCCTVLILAMVATYISARGIPDVKHPSLKPHVFVPTMGTAVYPLPRRRGWAPDSAPMEIQGPIVKQTVKINIPTQGGSNPSLPTPVRNHNQTSVALVTPSFPKVGRLPQPAPRSTSPSPRTATAHPLVPGGSAHVAYASRRPRLNAQSAAAKKPVVIPSADKISEFLLFSYDVDTDTKSGKPVDHGKRTIRTPGGSTVTVRSR